MTSPNQPKPDPTSDRYDDVHSVGSSFGQDLTENSVRDMLMSQGESPFQQAIGNFFDFVGNIGIAIGNAVGRLIPGINIVPLPPLYEQFTDEAFRALEPLHSMADEAIEKADAAQDRAEELSGDLTGFVEGDFADAISNYDAALMNLSDSVDAVTAQIPEVTGAAEAVAAAQRAVDEALSDLTIEIDRMEQLADQVDQSSQEYQDQVAAANAAAARVEDAVSDYSSRISAAEGILADMQDAQAATYSAAQEVSSLVGTPEWDEAVSGFVYWQDQLNREQSDFNQGVQSALDALDMVQNQQSDFNKGVRDALWVQDQVNQSQSAFNQGVQAAVDALAMVEEEQSAFNQGVETAIDALNTFANLQDLVNQDVEQALEELSGVADVSQLQWLTQSEYNEQNDIINRGQTEALMLHENELTMMNDARPRSWVFYTSQTHERPPWIAVRINDRSLGFRSHVDLTALGSWAGRVMVSISFYDQGTGSESAVDQYDWLVVPDDPSERTTSFNAGALHMGIRNVAVTLYPFWGNRKREFLLKPYEPGTSNGFALQQTEAYVNDMEGNPLEWGGQGSVRLPSRTVDMFGTTVTSPAKMVRANKDTYVYDNVYNKYVYWPQGDQIPAGAWIRAATPDLLVLTEV